MKNGCKYKTGCTTSRWKCKKSGTFCSPGCYCVNCLNSPISQNLSTTDTTSNTTIDTTTDNYDTDDEIGTSDSESETEDNIEIELVTDSMEDDAINILL